MKTTKQNSLSRCPLLHRSRLVSGLCVIMLVVAAQASTFTIDFNDIPNGTPLSQFSSFAFGGVLTLQGQEYEQWGYSPPTFPEYSSRTVAAGVFNGGQLQTILTFEPSQYPGIDLRSVFYDTTLTGTFLSGQVISLTFDSSGAPWHSYSCYGVDQNGVPFTSYGFVGLPNPGNNGQGSGTTVITAPTGGYLTGFDVDNSDQNPNWATLSLDNITVTVIPESAGLWALLTLALAGLILRNKRAVPRVSK